jgi:uncharacterized protein (DUF305 family)
MMRKILLTGAALASTVLLTACGSTDTAGPSPATTPATTPASAPASAAFNDADVTSAQSMIAHHKQAIEMSSMAGSQAASAEVKELATKIKAAQQPEIDTMNGWLTTWGKPTEMAAMGSNHSTMAGMMSDADMKALMGAKGAAFDKKFLTMMISHHEGAIEMAGQEATAGSSPEAVALAKKISADQQAQIATMKAMLAKL